MSTAILHEAPVRARVAVHHVPASVSNETAGTAVRHGYLVAAAVLAPLCVPAGPGQTAALDFVNVLALLASSFLLLAPGVRLRVPMLAPAALIVLGSLLALIQAPSIRLGVLALAQDIYLFAWFVLLANLLRTRADLRVVLNAWTGAAVVVSLLALIQIVLHDGSLAGFLGSRGFRPAGTLYNPNMLADYLVTSLFLASVALHGRAWPLRVVVGAVLFAGLLATKSNGGMVALGAGSLAWVVVRALTKRMPLVGMVAVVSLVAAVGGAAVWAHGEWGVGEGALTAFRQHTFAGRLEHSSESRLKIWDQLQRTYARSPLGIGPGNSGAISLGIAERERPDSWMSKEAHSDYLAYAIERGPLGVIGLLWWTFAGFAAVAAWARSARAPHRESRSSSVRSAQRYVRLPAAASALRHEAGWRDALTAAMAAALAASAMHSTVIEKLHFRHFWLLLGLVSASAFVASTPAEAAPVTRSTPAGPAVALALPDPRRVSRTLPDGTVAASRGALPVGVKS